MILEDNTAAIYLVRNQHAGQKTKHIAVRHHFILEHYLHNFVAITINTEDNDSDQMTIHFTLLILSFILFSTNINSFFLFFVFE